MKGHRIVLALWLGAVAAGAQAADRARIVVEIGDTANPWTHLEVNNDPKNFQFAIVSDRTGGARPGVFEDGIRKLNLLQPEFVMSVGDLIQGGTEDRGQLEREWAEFNSFVKGLNMPFFYVPGNHDISNMVMYEEWERRFGRSYYHFVYRDVLFLCLNSEDPPATQISERQVEYARKALADNAKVRWTLVFLHKPLWAYPEAKGWPEIDALLQGRPYTVFAGHWHNYQEFVRNDRKYIVLASTGGSSQLRGRPFGEFDHLVWVTMTDNGPILANLMLDGIWPDDVLTETDVALIQPALRGQAVRFEPFVVDSPTFRGGTATLRLTNDADVPVRVAVTLNPRGPLRPEPTGFTMEIPPNSFERIPVDIRVGEPIEPKRSGAIRADWTLVYAPDGERPVEVQGAHRFFIDSMFPLLRTGRTIAVDGKLDDWDPLAFECAEPAQVSGNETTWTGAGDCSYQFDVRHDDQFVYIAVKTVDDRLVVSPSRPPTAQDGVEVWLDARPTGAAFSPTDAVAIALSPGESAESTIWRDREKAPEGSRAACVKAASGFAAEVAVPLAYVRGHQGENWTQLRINVAVYDDDRGGGRPRCGLWWRHDWRSPASVPEAGVFRRQ